MTLSELFLTEMVRADGIEPTTPAWKVLPLNYARLRKG